MDPKETEEGRDPTPQDTYYFTSGEPPIEVIPDEDLARFRENLKNKDADSATM